MASQVAHLVADAGAGVGVASQVARFVVDAGAGVCVCGVAECDPGGVRSGISVVCGGLPSGVATRGGRPRRATWIHLLWLLSQKEILPVPELRLWGTGSQDEPLAVLHVVS